MSEYDSYRINPHLSTHKEKHLSILDMLNGFSTKNRYVLSRAITLIESRREEDREKSMQLLKCLPALDHPSLRIGITGSPGVGKSTFINQLAKIIADDGRSVAVLPIDPSSTKSQGSILGDKTRMESISASDDIFIRPSPSSNLLGGVAPRTRETISLCEASGYNTTLVETVGVGQSETKIENLVDLVILLLMPGAGDDLQGIKRGIMEIADVFMINKADGESYQSATLLQSSVISTMKIFRGNDVEWNKRVLLVSSIDFKSVDDVYSSLLTLIRSDFDHEIIDKRRSQTKLWLKERVKNHLIESFDINAIIEKKFPKDIAQEDSGNEFRILQAILDQIR